MNYKFNEEKHGEHALSASVISMVQEMVARRKFRGAAYLIWISRGFLLGCDPKPIWYRRRFRFICEPSSWYSVMSAFGFIHASMERVLEYLIQNSSKGITFVDAGANVGFVSLLACSIAKDKQKVFAHAFEPNPLAFEQFTTNFSLNNFQARANQAGLGAVSGWEEMVLGKDSVNSTLVPGGFDYIPNIGRKRVEVTTLDTYCSDFNLVPDIIKIDVEGYEPQVLRGGRTILKRDRPYLILEVNQKTLKAAQSSACALFEQLQELGYESYHTEYQSLNLREGHRKNWNGYIEAKSTDVNQKGLFNVLAVPLARRHRGFE